MRGSFFGFALLIMAASVSGVLAQTPRHAKSDGRPIAEQIRPNDTSVSLEINAFPPLLVTPLPGQSQVDFLTDGAISALVIRVNGKRSELTKDGTWIRSVVSARIERVLKNDPELRLKEGASIQLVENGGSHQFGPTTVEAVVPWAKGYEPGKRYLVFGGLLDGTFVASPAASFEEVNATTVRRLMKHDNPNERNDVELLLLDEAANRVMWRAESRNTR
jgi:hypothetical protein